MTQTARGSMETREESKTEPPTLDEIIERHARPNSEDESETRDGPGE